MPCKPLSLAVLIVFALTLACQPVVIAQVTITPRGGQYDAPCTVIMEGRDGFTIHYTLNGNIPTTSDALYTAPFTLSSDSYSRSNIFAIQNCPDTNWVQRSDVEHIVVVRAALFNADGVRRSEVATEAYLVNSLMERMITLPVVSICVDSAALFDFDSGIFIPGRFFDPANLFHSGNYCQKGREWERPANLSFIENGTTVLNQTCGLRIHGNRTRSLPQKGFTLYARQDYGQKNFSYSFFGDAAPSKFKRLVLRPWMGSWSTAGVEDWLCQQLATPLRCDNLATRPVVLFLNGEYWGIYFLEEKPDEHYIAGHYDYDDEDVDLLVNWGDEVENGSADDWNDMYQWLETADLTVEADYSRLASEVDVDALLDYMLLQIFIANVDWPANNVRHWSADGSPWRWIFFDGDAAFANWRSKTEMLDYVTCDDPAQTYPSSPHASLLFRRMLANKDFMARSIDRFGELIHYHFGADHSLPLVDAVEDLLADEVQHQSARFENPVDISSWRHEISEIRKYLTSRTDDMLTTYIDYFGLESGETESLIFPNPSAGQATLRYNAEWGGFVVVAIYDILGRQIYNLTYDLHVGINNISLPQLSPGLYLIRVSDTTPPLRYIVK